MPWCERCDRFLNPNTVATDGTCPSCGRTIEPAGRSEQLQEVAVSDESSSPGQVTGDQADLHDSHEERVRAPWHFWLMIGIVGVYLGWRLIQGIIWAGHNWF